ncbi:MAG: polynucleotide adenylyltransferase PcnB [Gammaproteobacteria bacterium]
MPSLTDRDSKSTITRLRLAPRIIPRAEHVISRAGIDDKALKVLYRLKAAGYQAYLVGGGVRDLLLGREPKDFDIATDALPEQIRELFRNCRLIGRRFRLAHIHFGREVIEVATFRGYAGTDDDEHVETEEGRIVRDNVYGDIDDDAWRRDFTVNALYYNIEDFSVVDYVGGLEDIKSGQIRMVGDPELRYREDPVRMLRACRFAVKLGFSIHADTAGPIRRLAPLLAEIPASRLFEEVLKLFMGGYALQTFELLRSYGLFGQLFPEVENCLAEEEGGFPHMLLVRALENTDRRIAEGKPVTPGFLLAALLWDPMRRATGQFEAQGMPGSQAMRLASDAVISRQIARVSIPRRFSQITREVWAMQPKLARRGGKNAFRTLVHPRFRAGYDFLALRGEVGEVERELVDWWTEFQGAGEERRPAMINELAQGEGGPRRRRRRRRAG